MKRMDDLQDSGVKVGCTIRYSVDVSKGMALNQEILPSTVNVTTVWKTAQGSSIQVANERPGMQEIAPGFGWTHCPATLSQRRAIRGRQRWLGWACGHFPLTSRFENSNGGCALAKDKGDMDSYLTRNLQGNGPLETGNAPNQDQPFAA